MTKTLEKTPEKTLEKEVGARLKAVMDVFRLTTNQELAHLCSSTHGAVNNWRAPIFPRTGNDPSVRTDGDHAGLVVSRLCRDDDPRLALRLNRRMREATKAAKAKA